MNPMAMGGMNPGNPAMAGAMPLMNNGANGVQMRPHEDHEEPNYESRLNTYIYGYFLKKGQWDLARSLKNSGEQFEPPLVHGEGSTNGVENEDSKDGIDSKRPNDLPQVGDEPGCSFLLNWFALFWDIYWAQRRNSRATPNATHFVALSQQQARQREQQQQQMMRAMGPNMMPGMDNYQASVMRQNQMMGIPHGDMRRGVLQQNQVRPIPQQLALQNMRAQQQQQQQHMMQRGMNGDRPRTPGGADHAPSPSKRARLEGAPFNGGQMMPNGRPMPPGMPGQQMMQHNDPQAQHANQLLMNNGINPGNLSDSQFASFQQQNPSVQQKSIQVYAQNMTKHQGERMKNAGGMSDGGSPMMTAGMDLAAGDFFAGNSAAAQQMRNGGMLPNGAPNGTGGNHALQDYQMQLMLLEQQNKKRLLMARQEQDITRPEGQPAIPGQAAFGPQGMSPQGSRGGPSPQPGDQARRGTPKMGQPGMPGSPMPDGRMTGSPAAINFNNMDPALYGAQMNGRPMQPPPSSNPTFSGVQMNSQQQIDAMQRAQAGVRMPNGQWQQGPPGQAPMMQPGQPGQPGQPNQMGTPQQRNDMPPPQGVPAATANGRPGSPAAPPTPQQSNKTNPTKGKKDQKAKKPTKKNSTASVAATPAGDAENPPATPTPSTPITPQHQNSFAQGKTDGQGPANAMQNTNASAPPQIPPQQPDPNAVQFANIETADGTDFMQFNDNLNDPNLLENFDFEQFLQGDAFSFGDAGFDADTGIEATGMGDP